MPTIVARLIMSMAVVFAAVVLFMPIFLVLESTVIRDDSFALAVTSVIDAMLLMVGWLAVWWGQVHWTPGRVGLTVASVPGAACPAGIIGGIVASVMYGDAAMFGLLFGAMVWSVVWITLTALIWRESRAERNQRLKILGIDAIACPSCGYNMTGLREPRCPECGSSFTLDQLYAAQHHDEPALQS